MNEPLYTLGQARRALALEECARHGHDWDIIQVFGGRPTGLVCARCGSAHAVVPKNDKSPAAEGLRGS